jgi:predicted RNase H-like HicB family nuclease
MANVKPTYRVTAARSGRWWAIEVPELRGVHSQARRLDQVEFIARAAIALMLDLPEVAFDLTIEPDLTSLGALQAAIEEALQAREAAELAQNRASTAMLPGGRRDTQLGVHVARCGHSSRREQPAHQPDRAPGRGPQNVAGGLPRPVISGSRISHRHFR